MKLIGSLSSPFAHKVRVVLAEKHIDYEFVIDAPADWRGKYPNLRHHAGKLYKRRPFEATMPQG